MNFKDLFHKGLKSGMPGSADKKNNNSSNYNGIEEDFDSYLTVTCADESYFGGGLSGAEQRRLKRGQLSIGLRCDLHGYTRREALPAVSAFLAEASAGRCRYVLLIFGKGNYSAGRQAVLKPVVLSYLKEHRQVIAYTMAHSKDGGEGAAYIVLRSENNR